MVGKCFVYCVHTNFVRKPFHSMYSDEDSAKISVINNASMWSRYTRPIKSNLLTYIKELKPRRQISVQTNLKCNVRPKTLLVGGAAGITLAVSLNFLRNGVVVRCHSDRTSGFRKATRPDEGKFDWAMFWRYLKPHLLKFLGAIAVRINNTCDNKRFNIS